MNSILLSKKRKFHPKVNKLFIFLFLLISTIFIEIYIFKVDIKKIKNVFRNIINKIFKFYNNYENNITYNINIMKSYINHQKNFCKFPYKYNDYLYENQITLTNFSLINISYEFYVYKNDDSISDLIFHKKNFEGDILINCLSALKYYKDHKNIINNKDIYILDIGGNIGVYPFFLGRFGYSILSFEPSPRNFYISKKNYCLNQNLNIIIINKGLSSEEKTCDYYSSKNNIGNGIALCNNTIDNIKIKNDLFKNGNITVTKLKNFIPFLSNKNVALIKIDIEGGEGKAIEGGLDLITKYHIPFIVLEFTPSYLEDHNTDPIKFLELFVNNGYKISLNGFLSNSFISINQIMNIINIQINLYFIYKGN